MFSAQTFNYTDLTPLESAYRDINPYLNTTPLVQINSDLLPYYLSDVFVYIKPENLQFSGSFKLRGALNKLINLIRTYPHVLEQGVVTASAGNHGAGVAYAGNVLGVPVKVFLPKNARREKVEKIFSYGAEIVEKGNVVEAFESAQKYSEANNIPYVHPYNDYEVINGQGTVGLEIMRECPETSKILVAVGGGGLITGIASLKSIYPGLSVIGAEPVNVPKLFKSLKEDRVVVCEPSGSRAVSLCPDRIGEKCFELAKKFVDEVHLVSDHDMQESINFIYKNIGYELELAAGAAFSLLFKDLKGIKPGDKIVIVTCGEGRDFQR